MLLISVLSDYGFVPMESVDGYVSVPFGTVVIYGDGSVKVGDILIDFSGDFYLRPDVKQGSLNHFGKDPVRLPFYRRINLINDKYEVAITALGGSFEVQFFLHPGEDPSVLTLEVKGGIPEVESGKVAVRGKDGTVFWMGVIKAFQGATEVEVYPTVDNNKVRFVLGDYDPDHTLVLDPVVVAIVTGSNGEGAYDMVIAPNGDVLLCGSTGSTDIAPSRTVLGTRLGTDAFVTRLSGDLTTHIATAIVSGSGDDYCSSLTLDDAGNVVLTGNTTFYGDFAPSRTIFGTTGNWDVFITKLSGDLSTHIATAIVGGSSSDVARKVKMDRTGSIVITGETMTPYDFAPSRTIFGTTGNGDVFVTKLSGDLSTHIATAIVGSGDYDWAFGLEVLSSGEILVGGETLDPPNFSPTRTVMGTSGEADGYVFALSEDLGTFLGTVLLAGSLTEIVREIYEEGSDILVVGWTRSPDFMPHRTVCGTRGFEDAFISRISSDLSTHINTVIVAGSRFDQANDVVVGPDGKVYVTGETFTYGTIDFSDTRIVSGTVGRYDAFVLQLNGDLSTLHSTLIFAGDGDDYAKALEVVSPCYIYVTGYTTNDETFTYGVHVYHGDTGSTDAYVLRTECPVGREQELNIVEEKERSMTWSINGGTLEIALEKPSYVGYDVYDRTGRRLLRVSKGFLLPGRYLWPIPLPKGTYTLLLRVGARVNRIAFIIR